MSIIIFNTFAPPISVIAKCQTHSLIFCGNDKNTAGPCFSLGRSVNIDNMPISCFHSAYASSFTGECFVKEAILPLNVFQHLLNKTAFYHTKEDSFCYQCEFTPSTDTQSQVNCHLVKGNYNRSLQTDFLLSIDKRRQLNSLNSD